MARYYFHIGYLGHTSERSSADLSGTAAAWEEAIVTCGQMLKDMGGTIKPSSTWKMTVTDKSGALVFEMQFSAKASVDF